MFGLVSPAVVTAKLFVLASSTNVVLAPCNNIVVYLKKVSFATLTTQLIVLVALLVAVLVAVSVVDVLAVTVGVPAIFAPVILKPVGNVSAVYVTLPPAALDALIVTFAIATSLDTLYVVRLAGLLHVTTSGLIVKLNARLVV